MPTRSETQMHAGKESRISHIPQLPPPRYGHSPSSPRLAATDRVDRPVDVKEAANSGDQSTPKPPAHAEKVQERQANAQPEPQSLRHTSLIDFSLKFNVVSFLAGILFTVASSHVMGSGYLRLIAAVVFGAAASAFYASMASPQPPVSRSRALDRTEKRHRRRSSPRRVPVPAPAQGIAESEHSFRPYGPRRGSEARSIRSGNDLWLGDK